MEESRGKPGIGIHHEPDLHTGKEEERSLRTGDISSRSQNLVSITWHSFEMLYYSPINQHQSTDCHDVRHVRENQRYWAIWKRLQTCSHVLRRSDIHLMRAVPTANSNRTAMTNYCHMSHHIICPLPLPESASAKRSHTGLKGLWRERKGKKNSRRHWQTWKSWRNQKRLVMWLVQMVCKPVELLLWKPTWDSLSKMDRLRLMPQSMQPKVVALQPNGVVDRFANGLAVISRCKTCQNHVSGVMQRCILCCQILWLLLNSECTSTWINGPWILRSCPNSHRTSLFQWLLVNTWNMSCRMKCCMAWKDIWKPSCFPVSIGELAVASHFQLLGDGFTRRVSNTLTTRRVYTLTGMTDQMLLNSAKVISCQLWRHMRHDWSDMLWATWTRSWLSHVRIMLSAIWCSFLRMKWQHKWMT